MAYEKQTWQNGDVITAEKLNHIEDGIGNNNIAVYTYHLSDEDNDVETLYNFIEENYGRKRIIINDEDWGLITNIIGAQAYITEGSKYVSISGFDYDGAELTLVNYTDYDPSAPNTVLRATHTVQLTN